MTKSITQSNNDIITTYHGEDPQGDVGDTGAWSSLADIAHYVKPLGTGQDDTQNIINAWNNYPYVVFKSGTYVIDVVAMWANRLTWAIPSNRLLVWEEGAVFTAKSNAYNITTQVYCFLFIMNQNITLVNPTLVGDIDNHTAWETSATQFQGFGISFYSDQANQVSPAKNIRILYPKISKMLADGIGVAGTNIWIESPLCDSNRRNGITISGGKNIVINNPICINSGSGTGSGHGIGPGTGIDIEVDPWQRFDGIRVNNGIFKNNLNKDASGGAGSASSGGMDFGLILSAASMTGSNMIVDVILDNCTFYDSGIACNLPGGIPGRFKILNPTIKNVTGCGIFGQYQSLTSPIVDIINPTIENWNTNNANPGIYNAAITFEKDNASTNPGIGNVNVINPTLSHTIANNIGIMVQDSSTGGTGLQNIRITNPDIVGVNTPLSLDNKRIDNSIILRGMEQLRSKVTGTSYSMSINVGTPYIDVNSSGNDVIVNFLTNSGTGDSEYTITNLASKSTTLKFVLYDGVTASSQNVYPLYPNGIGGLTTTDVGAVLKFKKTSSGIVVTSMTGRWYAIGDTPRINEQMITSGSATQILKLSPAQSGNFNICLFYRVTATANVNITVSYTDGNSAAQTMTILNVTSQAVGDYSVPITTINAKTTTPITVSVTGSAYAVVVSGSIIPI